MSNAPRKLPKKLTVTAASDFAPPPSELIELPDARTKDGAPVVVRVGLVPVLTLAPIMEGLPVDADMKAQQDASANSAVRRVLDWYEPAKKLARAGLVEPRFNFDDENESGDPHYDSVLSLLDMTTIFTAILRVSGWAGGERTREMRAFPADGEGRESGERPAAPVTNGAAAVATSDERWPTVVPAGSVVARP